MEGNAEYDRGFLEGSKTQNLADHKLIIEPLRKTLRKIEIDADYAKFHKCGDTLYYSKIAKIAKQALESENKNG
ncbi:hypothetical protein LCGC14_3043090 [marine sediment metagenome]|uniref:Uncharacterized protein n=1 Tax=marine sediment metagenome TaxID=412755 RepID=A0A0F8WNW6_9ZZZZ